MTCLMIEALQLRLDFCAAHGLHTLAEYLTRQITEHLDGGYRGGIDATPCDGVCESRSGWATATGHNRR